LDIHSLMQKFAELPNARVGQGPKRWPYPNPTLQKEIDDFLEQYPFLRRDQGYVDFLENYAGASADSSEEETPSADELVVDLFGFNDGIALHIVKDEGSIVSNKGFLCFCHTEVWNPELDPEFIVETNYLFDATEKRPSGIYRANSLNPEAVEWFGATFMEWLELLISKKGKLA